MKILDHGDISWSIMYCLRDKSLRYNYRRIVFARGVLREKCGRAACVSPPYCAMRKRAAWAVTHRNLAYARRSRGRRFSRRATTLQVRAGRAGYPRAFEAPKAAERTTQREYT